MLHYSQASKDFETQFLCIQYLAQLVSSFAAIPFNLSSQESNAEVVGISLLLDLKLMLPYTFELFSMQDCLFWSIEGIPCNKISRSGDNHVAKTGNLVWSFAPNQNLTRDRLINWGLQVDIICILSDCVVLFYYSFLYTNLSVTS